MPVHQTAVIAYVRTAAPAVAAPVLELTLATDTRPVARVISHRVQAFAEEVTLQARVFDPRAGVNAWVNLGSAEAIPAGGFADLSSIIPAYASKFDFTAQASGSGDQVEITTRGAEGLVLSSFNQHGATVGT